MRGGWIRVCGIMLLYSNVRNVREVVDKGN